MNIRTILFTLLAAIFLLGCEKNKNTGNEEVGGVIPEYQLEALTKAKSVEKTILDADKARREQMEKQDF